MSIQTTGFVVYCQRNGKYARWVYDKLTWSGFVRVSLYCDTAKDARSARRMSRLEIEGIEGEWHYTPPRGWREDANFGDDHLNASMEYHYGRHR